MRGKIIGVHRSYRSYKQILPIDWQNLSFTANQVAEYVYDYDCDEYVFH